MAIIAPDIGIDLGTSNTLVHVKRKGIVINEPTILVVDTKGKQTVKAIGDDAQALMGRTTADVRAVRPMANGTISDFEMTEYLLRFFMRKAIGVSRLVKPRAIITVPSRMSPIERRAVSQAAKYAGVRKNGLTLIEKPFAAALGSGLPVFEPVGNMVVDIGSGTTEVAVISLGGIVVSRSVRIGGEKMDEAINAYLQRDFNMSVRDRAAEEIKMDLGAAMPLKEERKALIRGSDANSHLPQTAEISSNKVYEALKPICDAILASIQFVLEHTPPELCSDIMRDGIHLTGGGALLFGLDQYIASELGIKVYLAKDPLSCTALGVGQLTDNYDLLHRIVRSAYQRDAEE